MPVFHRFPERMHHRQPFYGWFVAGAAALAAFASGPGQSYVFSIFIDLLLVDTGITRTTLSALYALGTGVSAAAALIISRLVDRFGPRLMLMCIAAAFGAACFGMSIVNSALSVLLGFAALRALGQGSLPVTSNLLVAQWFVRMRGRALAVVSLGFAASNALFPLFAQTLIVMFGWRTAYRVLGVVVWILVIPAALLVVRNRPELLGLQPDGMPPDFMAPPTTLPVSAHPLRAIWRTRPFWHLALPLTAGPFVITALVFHQASIFAEHGLAREVAAGVFTAFAVAAAVASTLSGFAIDRFGPRPVLFASLGLLCCGTAGLQLIDTPTTATLYAAIMGCAGGTQAVVGGAIWAHYYGRERLGAIQGAAAMVGITASALAPLPLAVLQQATGSYRDGLLLFAMIPLACAAVLSRFQTPRESGM